ncbi:MAG: hypothetical protein WD766_06250 [Gemmatimonadota bacterium]
MDSRIAAELLYESEATLRMVDDALDELRMAEPEPRRHPGGRAPDLSGFDSESTVVTAPSEFCVRAYWQVQDLLESVRLSRQALQAVGNHRDSGTDGDASRREHGGLDRALALVDRLDTLDDASATQRQALHAELRRDLADALEQLDRRTGTSDQLSAIALQLAEAEARLTKLAHLFEDGDA